MSTSPFCISRVSNSNALAEDEKVNNVVSRVNRYTSEEEEAEDQGKEQEILPKFLGNCPEQFYVRHT